MNYEFRIFDFHIYNKTEEVSSSDDDSSTDGYKKKKYRPNADIFTIQMFGKNTEGESCSITVGDFKPFFFIKVGDTWGERERMDFTNHIKTKIGKYHENNIVETKLVKHKKLYEFDAGKKNTFMRISFENLQALNKAKNIWYDESRKLLVNGYHVRISGKVVKTEIYESFIPPLLRFFHILDISPSGWIGLPHEKTVRVSEECKETRCDHEFEILHKDIVPLREKEDRVPLKIMSFDIEASSSHGDFPVPIKTYKKLATNIVDIYPILTDEKMTPDDIVKYSIIKAFGYFVSKNVPEEIMQLKSIFKTNVDTVYPKKKPTSKKLFTCIEKIACHEIEDANSASSSHNSIIESLFEGSRKGGDDDDREGNMGKYGNVDEDDDDYDDTYFQTNKTRYVNYGSSKNKSSSSVSVFRSNIATLLSSTTTNRETKINNLINVLGLYLPAVEGDKVTFIGSTFLTYGNKQPHYNHCIVLDTCDDLGIENTDIETYTTEQEVLMAWRNLVVRENPDIIIGYNIFGFDYNFMFMRAQETGCAAEFIEMSKIRDHLCGTFDKESGKYNIEHSSITIASGTHDLGYIKMPGRIQLDLYNHFRREENLVSYKLDYVAGHFIGDYVTNLSHTDKEETVISTKNMTGLLVGSYVHFEEIGHSTDYYEAGAKFKVVSIDHTTKTFTLQEKVTPDESKKVRWALAKDDVTPKDIFNLTNGDAKDRAVVAKYCIQDCNLVQYLLNKVDAITGMVEMANICSVPINFLILRGQGIKLTSYVGKKCREKGTLIPDIEKKVNDDGYEGAIVLDPKSDLYLDNPVACVDYASLYPSSMISENLSHDSKVWTKEYNLEGKLVETTGETDDQDNFIYDNLPEYKYVDVTYDTYKYVRKTPTAAAVKVKKGYKTCRFAQFPEGRAIMPSILEELLKARKSTRKLIPQQSDDFMKNVLDKRQLAYKLTANSLYGQCGARTSTFYEKDIAASTTATGRKLLTYAKRVIEEVYGDAIMETKDYGKVHSKAEYVYGDTDSVFFTFNLEELDGTPIRGKKALEITIELAKQAGEMASKFLKKPHDLEYEKTFMPFCLLSKKRYVGMLYEEDPNKGKRKEMGIVLKRRDNAPIVKEVYGGIIDILMKERDIKKAVDFLKQCIQNLVDEKYSMDKLIISKSIRSDYKNPQMIAHKVLADRMTARDPGNKPASGDRIPYVYIHNPDRKALQGEKIETPSYIIENNIKIDYAFYITNQVMKPVQQVFALVLEKIWMMQNKTSKLNRFKAEVKTLKKTVEPDKFADKLEALKNKEIQALLFDPYINKANNQKQGMKEITSFFACK
uniref:DNA-directed DNA polymerase n=1 Tax=viral metagenome TaxID=1070528 RepID=A0A6C0FFL7_9ZZZZ